MCPKKEGMSDLNEKSYPWRKPPEVGEFVWGQIQARLAKELGWGPGWFLTVGQVLRSVVSTKATLAAPEASVNNWAYFFLRRLDSIRRQRKHEWRDDEPHMFDDPIEARSRPKPFVRSRIAAGSEKSDAKTCRRDLKLSELRDALEDAFVIKIPESTLRRWAAAKKIPGVYSLKRGHYRVRICPKLCRWAAELNLAELRQGDRDWERHDKKQLVAFVHAIALDDRENVFKAFAEDPRLCEAPIAWLRPDELRKAGEGAVELRIVAAMNEITAKGLDSQATVKAVARMLGIPRSTFYRKGYDRTVKSFYRDATLRKDPRAKKLYASHVLQETDVDEQNA